MIIMESGIRVKGVICFLFVFSWLLMDGATGMAARIAGENGVTSVIHETGQKDQRPTDVKAVSKAIVHK